MPRLVGINHVAFEVGDIDEALAFWEGLFGPLTLRGRSGRMAFIDMGDQFVALSAGRSQPADTHRHAGIVVDDKQAVLDAARRMSADVRGPQRTVWWKVRESAQLCVGRASGLVGRCSRSRRKENGSNRGSNAEKCPDVRRWRRRI